MADTGWVSPGTIVDDSAVGTLTWSNPSNADTQNDTYASVSGGTNAQTHYLKATNFGFSVPSGADVDGIEVGFDEYYGTAVDVPYTVVRLVIGGSVVGDNNATGSFTTSDTDAYTEFGGAADLWGQTPDDSDVNASNFGVVLSINLQGPTVDAYVDHVRMKVTYTETGGTNYSGSVAMTGAATLAGANTAAFGGAVDFEGAATLAANGTTGDDAITRRAFFIM